LGLALLGLSLGIQLAKADPEKPTTAAQGKVLVAYYSLTGNTEKMAGGVVAGSSVCQEPTATLKKVDEVAKEDLESADLGAIAGAGLRLGLSTHSYWEVCRAWALQPSYIACGPIHPTRAKRMPWIAQGNDNLAYWCALLPLPVVAIAGMDGPRAAQAMQCGAAGVAVISAITGAPSPEAEIARLAQALQAGRLLPRRASPELPQSTLQRAY